MFDLIIKNGMVYDGSGSLPKKTDIAINSDKISQIGDLQDAKAKEIIDAENKIGYLLGYSDKPDISISQKTIFDFHLAHQTNPDFFFEPNESTKKIIWKYFQDL